jgi:hypothetical protein
MILWCERDGLKEEWCGLTFTRRVVLNTDTHHVSETDNISFVFVLFALVKKWVGRFGCGLCVEICHQVRNPPPPKVSQPPARCEFEKVLE